MSDDDYSLDQDVETDLVEEGMDPDYDPDPDPDEYIEQDDLDDAHDRGWIDDDEYQERSEEIHDRYHDDD
jgi:hypothetical protein